MYLNGNQVYSLGSDTDRENPFDTLSWTEIGEICNAGNAPDYFKVGDRVTINYSNTIVPTVEYVVVGINEKLCDKDSVHGLILQATGRPLTDVWASYSTNYSDSNVKGDTGVIYNYAPDDLKAVMSDATFYYHTSTSAKSDAVSTMTSKTFVLSAWEMCEHSKLYLPDDDRLSSMNNANVLSYYQNPNNPIVIPTGAWTRDRRYRYASYYGMYATSGWSYSSYTSSASVNPCFCIGTVV